MRALIAALLLMAAPACRHQRHVAAPARVLAVTPAPAPVIAPSADEEFLGVIMAPESVDVTSQLEGRVLGIGVRPGDFAATGALLATLDTRSARQSSIMATAELTAAESELEKARIERAEADERLERRQSTVELRSEARVSTVSKEELATSQYQARLATVRVAAAEASVTEKRAHVAEARALVEAGELRAPFAGTVVARYADRGALLRKGAPVVRLIGAGELFVRFAVPEERAGDVASGDTLVVTTGVMTLTAVVEKIAPEIDAASRTLFVEATLRVPPELRGRVRSGQVAHLRRVDHGT
ncbi:MAG TPA: efflux RND transporter periplasmic adaptor subunit [Polyangia bacterium]|jgi:HlyD family secretion protein